MKKIIVFITFSCLSLLIAGETTLDFGKFGERKIEEQLQPLESDESKSTQSTSSCTGYIWLKGYLKVKTKTYWFYREDKVYAESKTLRGNATSACGSAYNSTQLYVGYNSSNFPVTLQSKTANNSSFVSVSKKYKSAGIFGKAEIGNEVYSQHKATMSWGIQLQSNATAKVPYM